MNIAKFLIVVVLLLCGRKLYGQSVPDTIQWRSNYKLKWKDFQGMTDSNSIGDAGTSSGFGYKSSFYKDSVLIFNVYAVFFKNVSWVKSNYMDPSILNHEQGHFDITEVFARKLNIAFKKHKFNKAIMQKDAEKIYNEVKTNANMTQALYDKETMHSINDRKQKEWDIKIARWLKSITNN